MVPVVFGRLNGWDPTLHAVETHYLADAVPILAIVIGFALLPLTEDQTSVPEPPSARKYRSAANQTWRIVTQALVGVFIFGSIWSIQAYEKATNGNQAKSFISNAEKSVKLAPQGTLVLDWPVPEGIMSPLFGKYARDSVLIGDIARGKLEGRLKWINHPAGTIDGLQIFGTDGKLYPATVFGVVSKTRSPAQGCWPQRHGRIVVRFVAPTSVDSWELRIGYLWYPPGPGFLTVRYGKSVQALEVAHGLHSAYLPVRGSATRIVVNNVSGPDMCIGDVEAGAFGPY